MALSTYWFNRGVILDTRTQTVKSFILNGLLELNVSAGPTEQRRFQLSSTPQLSGSLRRGRCERARFVADLKKVAQARAG